MTVEAQRQEAEEEVYAALKQYGPTPGAKKMMRREVEAAEYAQETGLYGVWRGPNPGADFCARIGPFTRCFCGHSYQEHKWTKSMKELAPACSNCSCKRFKYVPCRPEEAGEYWLPRRRGFDVSLWSAKCRCGESHEAHDPNHLTCPRGKRSSPSGQYDSAWECVSCNKKWQEHETVFELEQERQSAGLPVRHAFFPMAEQPEMLDMVLNSNSKSALPWRPKPERSVILSGHARPVSLRGQAAVRPQGKALSQNSAARRQDEEEAILNANACITEMGIDIQEKSGATYSTQPHFHNQDVFPRRSGSRGASRNTSGICTKSGHVQSSVVDANSDVPRSGFGRLGQMTKQNVTDGMHSPPGHAAQARNRTLSTPQSAAWHHEHMYDHHGRG